MSSSTTNALSQSVQQQTQVVPVIKASNEIKENITPEFVKKSGDLREVSSRDSFKEKKQQSGEKSETRENEEEFSATNQIQLLSENNLKILNEINIEFLEYDKLNNMKKFQTHLNSFQDFLPNNSNL